MKNCKACQKEIDDKATKCPYCQAYQKWYTNPQYIGMIFPLIFISYIYFYTGIWDPRSYIDYKNSFSVEKVSSSTTQRKNIHTYNITNKTKYKWDNMTYQFIGKDKDGQVIVVESEKAYSWAIMPNSTSMLSITVDKNLAVTNWELQILDIGSSRF